MLYNANNRRIIFKNLIIKVLVGTSGTITSVTIDGTFKSYVVDKKLDANSIIVIVGRDKSQNILAEMIL